MSQILQIFRFESIDDCPLSKTPVEPFFDVLNTSDEWLFWVGICAILNRCQLFHCANSKLAKVPNEHGYLPVLLFTTSNIGRLHRARAKPEWEREREADTCRDPSFWMKSAVNFELDDFFVFQWPPSTALALVGLASLACMRASSTACKWYVL